MKNLWKVSILISFFFHIVILFPHVPFSKITQEAEPLITSEVILYKKPPPKKQPKKPIKKNKLKPKPKPKKIIKPPSPKKIIKEFEPMEASVSKGNQRPIYPRIAIKRGWEGTVVLRVEVLDDGSVGGIIILSSSGRKILDKSALKSVKTWMFKPATNNYNKAIRSFLKVPVEFRLQQN